MRPSYSLQNPEDVFIFSQSPTTPKQMPVQGAAKRGFCRLYSPYRSRWLYGESPNDPSVGTG